MRAKSSAARPGRGRRRVRRQPGEATPCSDSPSSPSATPIPNPSQVEAGTSSGPGDEAVVVPGANGASNGVEKVVSPECSQGRRPPEDLCPESRGNHQELDEAPCLRFAEGGHLLACSRCNEDGHLLACSEGGCPTVIHEECLGCEPSFDESGRFYCPYCTYKRVEAKLRELGRNVVLAEKKKNDYLNSRVHLSGQDKSNNDNDKEANKDGASQLFEPIHHLPEKTNSSKDLLAGHQSEKGKLKPVAASLPGGSSNGQKDDRSARNQTTEGIAGPSMVSPQVMPQPLRAFPSMEHSYPLRTSSRKLVNGDAADQSNLRFRRPRNLMEVNLLSGKRKRLNWRPEEEDKLTELVPLFSSNGNKNIPWRKIQELGRPVFHESRTPSDFKDKWRTMTRKR